MTATKEATRQGGPHTTTAMSLGSVTHDPRTTSRPKRKRRARMTPREDKKLTRNVRQAFDSAGLEATEGFGKTGRDTLAAAVKLTDAGGRLDATHVEIASHMPTTDTRSQTGHSDRRKAGLGMAQIVKTGFYVRTAHSHTLPGGRRCVRYSYQLAAWVMNRLKALGQLIRLRPPRKTNSLLIPTVVKKVVVVSQRMVNGRALTLADVFRAYPEMAEPSERWKWACKRSVNLALGRLKSSVRNCMGREGLFRRAPCTQSGGPASTQAHFGATVVFLRTACRSDAFALVSVRDVVAIRRTDRRWIRLRLGFVLMR
jgi:hypothetical protein